MSMAYQPKSYRKFLAGTVSAAVVASAIAPVASASFTDVAGSVHANDIATLVAKGYIKGYADGTFKPDKPLTRGEAAIIFSRILKDAGVKAPEQGAGFPDVPASKAELAEAVAIVKAAGVMGGDEKGNFNPNANITREQMAKVVVEAFKLTKPENHTTKITDLDKAGSWAREYIQTLEANGVTKNTEFAPKQNVTRGQFASFVVRAMDVKKEVSAADITAVKLVDEKTLEVTFNGELKEVKKEDFAIQGVEIESVSIKAAAAAEAKTTVVVIKTKTALQEGKSYSVSYKGQTTDKAKVDLPVVTPKVESVSAINAKELVVKFNKAIDKSTVIADATTGTLVANTITVGRTVADTDPNKNVSSVKGSLSEDGKTLTLTAAGATYFDGTYALTIADSVKTTDGKALTAYAGTFTAKDTVAPSATGVTFNTVTGNIEVTFSEPLIAKPDVVRVNGQPIAAADITLSGDAKKITFAKPTSLAAGSSAEIYVTGAKDAAGNSLAPFTGSVTITNDATALQVASITQVASNKVKVVFNKSIATSEANVDDAINVILGGVTLGDAEVVVTKDASDTSNKTYFVEIQKSGTTAPNYFYGTDSSKALTFVFVDQAIADVFGQKLATTTQTVTMTKDVAGPKFVSAKVGTTNGTIEVTLDEEISSSVDASKITVRKDGIALSNPVTAAKKGSSNGAEKVLVITLEPADLDANGKLNAGTYSVRLDSGAVQDVHTNKNDIITTSVTKDATTTDLTATISTVAGQRNKFEVVYSESVTSSALNPANYTLDGKALPAGTDIYFKGSTGVDARTAVIVLPSNSINIGVVGTGVNASLAVKDVVTSTGKKVVPTSGTVLVEDNTPAKLKSATLIGSNILKLTFDENITASGVSTLANVLSELEIKATDGTALTAGTTGSATVSTSGKDLIITITPGDSNWSTVTGSSTVTVKTLDSGSTDGLTDLILDANGVKVKAGEAVTLTK